MCSEGIQSTMISEQEDYFPLRNIDYLWMRERKSWLSTFSELGHVCKLAGDRWMRAFSVILVQGIAVLDNARILVVGGEGHIRNDSNIKIPKHVNEVRRSPASVGQRSASQKARPQFQISLVSDGFGRH
jgi:hypothetical protein